MEARRGVRGQRVGGECGGQAWCERTESGRRVCGGGWVCPGPPYNIAVQEDCKAASTATR